MDLKNTLAAVSLSAAIIVLWGLFFAPDPQEVKNAQIKNNELSQNEDAPELIQNDEIKVTKTRLLLNKKLLFKKFKKRIEDTKAIIMPIPPTLKSLLLGCFLLEGLSKILNLSPTFNAIGMLK